MALSELLHLRLHSLQVDAAVVAVAAHANIAGKYGKPLIAYEAGSSIDGSSGFAAQVRPQHEMLRGVQLFGSALAKDDMRS